MPIKVNISLSAGGRIKPVSSHTLHEKHVTVGRDRDCTLTLEDTQKHVSRTHAEFLEEDGRYWMKVVSKVNPVLCNGKRYMYGDRAPLSEGDHITIGLYRLDIVAAEVAPPPSTERAKPGVERLEDITYIARPEDFLRPATAVPRTPPPKASPPPVAKAEPVASPLPKPAAPPPPASPTPRPAPAPTAESPTDEATYIPPAKGAPPAAPPPKPAPEIMLPDSTVDDEVTYIPPMSARPSPPRASSPTNAPAAPTDDTFSEDLTSIRRPFAELQRPPAPAGKPAEVDFDLSETVNPLATPSAPQQPAESVQEGEHEAGFSEDLTYVGRPMPRRPVPQPPPQPTAQPTAQPAAQPTSADAGLQNISDEETFVRPTARVETPQSSLPKGPTTRGESAGTDRAVQAFLEGAGLSHLKIPDPESFMRDSGVMVRSAVEAIMMLLIARQKARNELGAEPEPGTDEDPVKSMADPAEVIAFLFDPKRPAIANADPVKSFGEACSDLRAHQAALFEGMRAAVQGALRSLDPKKIEREHGVNVGGLNLTRKSKLWDISVAEHERITREIEEDFAKAFGREILEAYTAQVNKIRRGR